MKALARSLDKMQLKVELVLAVGFKLQADVVNTLGRIAVKI